MKTTLKLAMLLIALGVLSPTWAWGKEPGTSPRRGIGSGRGMGPAGQCQQTDLCCQVCDNCIGNERDKKASSANPLNRSTGQGQGKGQGYGRGVGRQECQGCSRGEGLGREQGRGRGLGRRNRRYSGGPACRSDQGRGQSRGQGRGKGQGYGTGVGRHECQGCKNFCKMSDGTGSLLGWR